MAESPHRLVLGSGSPRRHDLLAQLGHAFTVEVLPIDEAAVARGHREPDQIVREIARAKFAAFAPAAEPTTLLTADTVVWANDQVMGKPTSKAHLARMLQEMSGTAIVVWTAVCVGSPGFVPDVELVSTQVQLRQFAATEIETYCSTDVGMDKAGGLALQSDGRRFMRAVDGCWSNVLGLPVCAVEALLATPRTARSCEPVRCGSGMAGLVREPADGTGEIANPEADR